MISKNLILRYINGHTSEEETKEVVEWIKASEENQRSYMNIRKLNDLIIWNSDADTKAKESLQVVKSLTLSKVFRITMSIAAIFIIFLASHNLYIQYHHVYTDTMQVLVVPSGQRAEITLIDGTKVWLNAGSTLRFPSQFADDRHIQLK